MNTLKTVLIVLAVIVLSCMHVANAGEYQPADCAFGEDGSWMVLYRVASNNRWVVKNWGVSSDLIKEINEVSSEGYNLTGVALDGKNGWTVSYESNKKGFTKSHNVFASVAAKIKEIHAEGWFVKDIALTPDEGYLIIYGQSGRTNGWTGQNVPASLSIQLDNMKKEGGYPVGCGISPSGGWVLIYSHKNSNCWHMRSGGSIPQEAAKFLDEKF